MVPRIIFSALMMLMGISSIGYSFIIMRVHSGSKFFIFWDVCGILFILLGIGFISGFFSRLSLPLKIILSSLASVSAIIIIVLVSLIFSCYGNEAQQKLDYIIVLGAQVRADGPSIVLSYRLSTALDYLNANPDTKCVVTGAQGSNEPCTEALAMKEYLVSHGIAADRILLEEKAVNTRQNIIYSKELIPEGSTVGIVTNRFHMYRALFLCRKFGIENASPINSYSVAIYEPNNVIREVFGLMKDWIF